MKLWRCYNGKCSDKPGIPGHDFANDTGKCDRCGVDPSDKRFGYVITARVVLHFDAPSGIVDGRGVGYIACDPSKAVGKFRSTGDPNVVNCPACQATESFKAAIVGDAVHPDFDVPVTIDAKSGTMKMDRESLPEPKQPCGGC